MKADGKKRQQVLLRLPKDLIVFLKEKAEEEQLALTRFCEKYLELARFLEIRWLSGWLVARQLRRRFLMIPAVEFDKMYGERATYREGRRMGLELAPILSDLSVEDTLALFTIYGWGVFEFQAELGRVINFNPPITSSEFIRGGIEGLTGLNLRTLSADRDVFVYEIVI